MAIFAPLHTGQFVVRPRARARRRMTVSIIVLLAVVLPYITFEVGRSAAGYSVTNSFYARWTQTQRIQALEDEVGRLRREVSSTQIGQTVDQHSAASLQHSVDELQDQLQQQRAELSFYQSIVSPAADTPNEPSVQRIEIEPTGTDNQFLLRVVLIQPLQAKAQAQGTLRIEVAGMRGSEPVTLALNEMTGAAQTASVKFGYRYFQVVEQLIELAPDFSPNSVAIELHASQRTAQRQSFPWQLQQPGGNGHVQTS